MRFAIALALLTACGPKVGTQPPSFDEDLPQEGTVANTEAAPPADVPRVEAPPGKGLRTGTIERAKLVAVLDAGPGAFLRQLEVTPKMREDRFVGWQLVQVLDRKGPLFDLDVVPGDVLLAINDKPLSRPDQLKTLWDSLRLANTVKAQLWRGDAKFTLEFAIEPPVSSPPAFVPTPEPPAQR